MEYQALYRRYRPQRFADVVGQEHVTHTLAREVVDDRISHAYLFAGPRGTGKTTTARLLAKALNCADRGPDSEPCNVCVSCVGIAEGTSIDVIELDAASHNKVEDVREIRVNVGTVAAAAGARRVYILDEAHMLSRAAGNALLKTLEEPPGHVVFVLATTEPYKLLDTIRSRSQRFDFHPVATERIVDHLGDIAAAESITTSPGALNMIAAHARGSVRDAMSLMEQVAALGEGAVESEVVTRALGLADQEAYELLLDAIVAGDAAAALILLANLAARGTDLRRFVATSLEHFRGIFLAQYSPDLEQVVDEPVELIEEWRRQAKLIGPADVLRTIDILGDALLELRQGREERLVIELAILRLTRPETTPDTAALTTRIERLEQHLRNVERPSVDPAPPGAGRPAEHAAAAAPSTASPATGDTSDTAAPEATDAAPAVAEATDAEPPDAEAAIDDEPGEDATDPKVESESVVTVAELEGVWPALVARTRETAGPVRHALVKEAVPKRVEAGVALLEIPANLTFHLDRLREDTELATAMAGIVTDLLGRSVGIEFVGAEGVPEPTGPSGTGGEATRAPDKDELADAGASEDPEDIVADLLGGEVVSDQS